MIEKKHLDDNFCNMVMHLADNGMNEVIVYSSLLEDYIRKNYPNYKITSSTCKRITNQEQLCSEIEKDYNIVVIDYDLNHNFDVLKKISDKKKCELLVNACCNPECPTRTEHYEAIGLQQIAYANHVKKYQNVPFNIENFRKTHLEILRFNECSCVGRNLFQIVSLKNHISPDEIWNTYIPMGFEQFKIEGRTAETLNLIEYYMYYMIKPECKEQARFEFMKCLSENGVITIEE